MKRFFGIPLLVALVAIVGSLLLAGFDFSYLSGLSALTIVFVGSVGLMRTHYGFGEMFHAFRCAGRNFAASQEELVVAAAFFSSARSTLIGTGLVGLVFGVIRVLQYASQMTNLPSDSLTGFSVALITIMYGLSSAVFIIGPFAGAIQKKLALAGGQNRPPFIICLPPPNRIGIMPVARRLASSV